MLGMEVKLDAQAKKLESEMKISKQIQLFADSLEKVSDTCTSMDTMMVTRTWFYIFKELGNAIGWVESDISTAQLTGWPFKVETMTKAKDAFETAGLQMLLFGKAFKSINNDLVTISEITAQAGLGLHSPDVSVLNNPPTIDECTKYISIAVYRTGSVLQQELTKSEPVRTLLGEVIVQTIIENLVTHFQPILHDLTRLDWWDGDGYSPNFDIQIQKDIECENYYGTNDITIAVDRDKGCIISIGTYREKFVATTQVSDHLIRKLYDKYIQMKCTGILKRTGTYNDTSKLGRFSFNISCKEKGLTLTLSNEKDHVFKTEFKFPDSLPIETEMNSAIKLLPGGRESLEQRKGVLFGSFHIILISNTDAFYGKEQVNMIRLYWKNNIIYRKPSQAKVFQLSMAVIYKGICIVNYIDSGGQAIQLQKIDGTRNDALQAIMQDNIQEYTS